jgi:hypothetical protein
MNNKERGVYKIEKQVIENHFPGLKPRPVKLIHDEIIDGRASDDFMEINETLLKSSRKKDLQERNQARAYPL